MLAALGDATCLGARCVAVVGTRRATAYGRATAKAIAAALARSGATVVSGGASGIDAAAHAGALDSGGRTVSVMGCGADVAYPAENAGLFTRVRAAGAIVSGYAFGARAQRHTFVERDGLIAALSDAVIVVEAPAGSGALITAARAAELGRPVLVAPANVEAATFRGSHDLIRAGARLIGGPRDALADLGLQDRPPRPPGDASASGERLLRALAEGPRPPELLAATTGLDPGEVMSELTLLELDGRVLRTDGRYALVP